MAKEIIKQLVSNVDEKRKAFKLTKKEIVKINGKKYAQMWFLSVEEYYPGYQEALEVFCRVTDGYNDIDVESLNPNCLTGDQEANKEALIAA